MFQQTLLDWIPTTFFPLDTHDACGMLCISYATVFIYEANSRQEYSNSRAWCCTLSTPIADFNDRNTRGARHDERENGAMGIAI